MFDTSCMIFRLRLRVGSQSHVNPLYKKYHDHNESVHHFK